MMRGVLTPSVSPYALLAMMVSRKRVSSRVAARAMGGFAGLDGILAESRVEVRLWCG